jgi:hypothetical protein
MEYSERVKRVIWIVVILIVIFLGLKTEYYLESPRSLKLYGINLYSYTYRGSEGTVTLGDYKYALIGATLLIGLAAIATMNKNKTEDKTGPGLLKRIWTRLNRNI